MQAIAGRPFLVGGSSVCHLDGDNDGLARDLCGDNRTRLLDRVGVDGEQRLGLARNGLENDEWFRFAHVACSSRLVSDR